MIKIKEEQIEYLRQFIEDIDNLIEEDDLEKLLDEINLTIIDNFDEEDESTDISTEIQKIWDYVYYENNN